MQINQFSMIKLLIILNNKYAKIGTPDIIIGTLGTI